MTHWLHPVLPVCAAIACASLARAQQVLSLPLDRSPTVLSPRGDHVAGPGLSGGAGLWVPGGGWEELGGPGGAAIAVSNDGDVVLANGVGAGALWVRGIGWGSLGFVGGQRGMALSSDGRYVAAQSDPGGARPYLWDRQTGALTRFELPSGADRVEVSAVSLGAILSVGTAHFPSGVSRAAVWDAVGEATLVAPPGSTGSAVSENGEWGAGAIPSVSGTVPFRWNRSIGRIDLPPLGSTGGFATHAALKVSDDGALVIGNRAAAGAQPEGFAWTPVNGTQSFAAYLQSEGLGDVGAFTTVVSAAADGRRFLLGGGAPAAPARFFNVDAQVSSSYCGSGSVNSTGAAGAVYLLGANSPDLNGLFLRATGLPAGVAVLPLASRDAAILPLAGGSAGTLCLGGAIGRFPVSQGGPGGTLEVRVDLLQIPTAQGPVPGLSGQTWRFQCWYRDPSMGGSNFTDGTRVLLD